MLNIYKSIAYFIASMALLKQVHAGQERNLSSNIQCYQTFTFDNLFGFLRWKNSLDCNLSSIAANALTQCNLTLSTLSRQIPNGRFNSTQLCVSANAANSMGQTPYFFAWNTSWPVNSSLKASECVTQAYCNASEAEDGSPLTLGLSIFGGVMACYCLILLICCKVRIESKSEIHKVQRETDRLIHQEHKRIADSAARQDAFIQRESARLEAMRNEVLERLEQTDPRNAEIMRKFYDSPIYQGLQLNS